MEQHTEPSASVASIAENANEGPQINSIDDLYCHGESVMTKIPTEGEQTETTHNYACFISQDDIAYYGETLGRGLTVELLKECLRRVPDNEIYPEKSTNITLFSQGSTDGLHLKRPYLLLWKHLQLEGKNDSFVSNLFLGEIEAFELLHKHPHPNIVRYHGCRTFRGVITAIVMDRHPTTLGRRLEKEPYDLDTSSIFKDIDSAVKHLHSLGLAHNDLNPNNVVLNEAGQAILIDFGACKPFGARLSEGGTTGWVDEDFWYSERKHDEVALEKISAWLSTKTGPAKTDQETCI